MPTLDERIDRSSVRVVFPPLPKGRKRGRGMTFFGGDPVALLDSAGATPPYRWVNGKPEPITFQDIKKLNGRGGSEDQLAGFWYTPKQDERAIVWTRAADGSLSGVELHPAGWQKSVALACGGGQQVGYGYRKFVKDPDRALLWSGSAETLIELTAADPSRGTMAHAVADGVQVGKVTIGGPEVHACLWRGSSETFEDLHPAGMLASEAVGVGDGQQVGSTVDDAWQSFAALWTGSATSYVSLAPEGFKRSQAKDCARGFQVGWVSELDRGMSMRATLWNGSAADRLDLHGFLPEPWNVSSAIALHVDGDRLRVLGSVNEAVQSGGYEVNKAEVPVVWEIKLKIAEPPARRSAAAIAVEADAPTAESAERRVDRAVDEFAGAVIAKDFKKARGLLAPWLQKDMSAAKLKAFVKEHSLDDNAPADFQSSGNDATLELLRSLSDGRVIPDAVTAENFRQWLMVDFTPDPDAGSQLDYNMRLWLIVVEIEGAMKIGYLEPEY